MKNLLSIFIAVLICAAFDGLFWMPSKAQSVQESTNLFEVIELPQTQSLSSFAAVREQEIKINFDRINFETIETLSIPLLNGKSYKAARKDSGAFEGFANDEFTWRGKILGDNNRSGDVILTVKDKAVSGLIYSPGAVYEIIPQDSSNGTRSSYTSCRLRKSRLLCTTPKKHQKLYTRLRER